MAVSDTSRTSMESPELVLKKTFVSRKGDLSEEEMIRRGADAKGPIVKKPFFEQIFGSPEPAAAAPVAPVSSTTTSSGVEVARLNTGKL